MKIDMPLNKETKSNLLRTKKKKKKKKKKRDIFVQDLFPNNIIYTEHIAAVAILLNKEADIASHFSFFYCYDVYLFPGLLLKHRANNN